MALFRQVGSILKPSISKNSTSFMLNSVRPRSISSTVYVGGLSYGTDDRLLTEAFSSFGEVTKTWIILDKIIGRSRGFGFVKFADVESAKRALAMDGQEIHGRTIRVSISADRPRIPRGVDDYGRGAFGGAGGGMNAFRGY